MRVRTITHESFGYAVTPTLNVNRIGGANFRSNRDLVSQLYSLARVSSLPIYCQGKALRLWVSGLFNVSKGRLKGPGRLAQLVRAPALQAGGRRFESCTAHQT
jgi:hypothetical protein